LRSEDGPARPPAAASRRVRGAAGPPAPTWGLSPGLAIEDGQRGVRVIALRAAPRATIVLIRFEPGALATSGADGDVDVTTGCQHRQCR
jgi:hypothetical protein